MFWKNITLIKAYNTVQGSLKACETMKSNF